MIFALSASETAGPQQAASVPPSAMDSSAPFSGGVQLPALIFFSSGARNLSHTQTDEQTVASGANSRMSRW